MSSSIHPLTHFLRYIVHWRCKFRHLLWTFCTYCVNFLYKCRYNHKSVKSLVKSHFKQFTHFCCKIGNVANNAFFGVIFLPQKMWLWNFFGTFQVWVLPPWYLYTKLLASKSSEVFLDPLRNALHMVWVFSWCCITSLIYSLNAVLHCKLMPCISQYDAM